jgi:hypothetical protein
MPVSRVSLRELLATRQLIKDKSIDSSPDRTNSRPAVIQARAGRRVGKFAIHLEHVEGEGDQEVGYHIRAGPVRAPRRLTDEDLALLRTRAAGESADAPHSLEQAISGTHDRTCQ